MANNTAASPGSPQGHFVDIHEVFHEQEHRDHHPSEITRKPEKQSSNRPLKPHDHYPKGTSHARFNRQVSLETGFSALQKQSKVNGDRKLLSRSGESFGGFSSSNNGVVTEGRKDDFSIFRTKSTLSKQNSFLPLKKDSDHAERLQQTDNHNLVRGHEEQVNRSVPAGRYFAALRGPELDQVKENEDILLPKDELWPFLLRFPINCFGICLGLSSQTILWRALASSPATQFLHIPIVINLILWILALGVLILVSVTYVLKCVFYFEAVRREYFHPVRVNFFFAPWIVCMFLAIGIPPIIFPNTPHPAIWCIFMAPLFVLELKIYGQWLSGGKRRLSKVANPSTHLSVVGNFVGAILASKVGWQEPAKFFWAVGFAHYLVLFVTLYQRLPTSEALPKELHPVYCMFIAAPSAASIAWETIYGEFNGLSRTCYFIALFLYLSLVVRINFFRGFGFSVAWWSYTFPMTTASLATIKYAEQVPCFLSNGLALTLSFVSSMMVSVLFVSTLLHAFIWKSLLPNDLAIAITEKKNNGGKAFSKDKKPFKKAYDIRRWTKQSPLSFGSSGAKINVESHDFSEVQKGVNEQ